MLPYIQTHQKMKHLNNTILKVNIDKKNVNLHIFILTTLPDILDDPVQDEGYVKFELQLQCRDNNLQVVEQTSREEDSTMYMDMTDASHNYS